jgi:drug/metabolite transporter (DMT)-like permease
MTNFLLYLATVLVWGSTWFAIEFQLGEVAIEVSLAYRYLGAATLLFVWCTLRGLRMRFDLAAHRYFVLLGIFLFGFNYVLTYQAQVYLTSALSAIAFSSMVWMNIINSRIFLGTRIETSTLLGALLGLCGIVVIFWPEVRQASLSDTMLLGASLTLSGAAVASLGNIISQRAQQKLLPIVQTNAWGMLYGGLLLTLSAIIQGKPFIFDFSTGYVFSLAYLSVFGSVIGFGCYLTLLGRIGAHKDGYVVIMFPIVAFMISAFFEDLDIDANLVAGAGIALAGNLLVLLQRRRSDTVSSPRTTPIRRQCLSENAVPSLRTEGPILRPDP